MRKDNKSHPDERREEKRREEKRREEKRREEKRREEKRREEKRVSSQGLFSFSSRCSCCLDCNYASLHLFSLTNSGPSEAE